MRDFWPRRDKPVIAIWRRRLSTFAPVVSYNEHALLLDLVLAQLAICRDGQTTWPSTTRQTQRRVRIHLRPSECWSSPIKLSSRTLSSVPAESPPKWSAERLLPPAVSALRGEKDVGIIACSIH